MHFHNQSIRTHHRSRARQYGNERSHSRRVTGIHNDWQMRHGFQHGQRSNVERVASGSFKSSNAALAKNDLWIASHGDHLRRMQEVFEGGGHAALEEDRASASPERIQQSIILHAPR